MDGEELLEQGLEVIEVESVGSVGFGVGGIVVDFQEDAVDAGGNGGAREYGDELRLAAGDAIGSRWCLHGVRAVEDDGGECAHDGERAHVDDEIVIAEAGAALGEKDAGVAGGGDLLNGVLHVLGCDELSLLHVDGATGFSGGDQQVGLAAEEGRNLKDIAGLGCRAAVLRLVHVGEDGEVRLSGDAAQDARAFGEAGTAEAGDRGAIGLVIGSLEDVGDAEVAGDALNGIGHEARVLLAFDDARAGDEEELTRANRDIADFEVVNAHRERIARRRREGVSWT